MSSESAVKPNESSVKAADVEAVSAQSEISPEGVGFADEFAVGRDD